MKKLLLLLFVALLLASCTSGRREMDEDESARNRLILIQAERNALIETESEVFQHIDDLVLPSSYAVYSADLPQFRRLQEDYIETLRVSLEAALGRVIDYLLDYLDGMEFEDVTSYFEAGYSSVSDELEATQYETVYTLFLEGLEENEETMSESYSPLEREASIWRENQLNLALVGQRRFIARAQAISNSYLAEYGANRFFATLSENEVGQRRLLIDGI